MSDLVEEAWESLKEIPEVRGAQSPEGVILAIRKRVEQSLTARAQAPLKEAAVRVSLAPEMRDLLKELEWAQHHNAYEVWVECPACGREKTEGHYPDCRLGNLLKTLEGL